jgi:hypothetical protein
LRGVLRECGEDACEAEQHESGLQGEFAAKAIAERAHGEQDSGEGQ